MAAAHDGLLPRRMIETEKLKDVNGDLVATTVSTFEIVREGQGRAVRRLLSATRNGKEYTEKKRAELDEQATSKEVFARPTNIFLAENQAKVEVRRTQLTDTVAGLRCTAFRFTFQGEHGPVGGHAWLDEASGAPLLVETQPTSFPNLEKLRFKRMSQRFGYRLADGLWMLETMQVRAEIELKKLLDVAMLVETSIRFEGHEGPGQAQKAR